MSALHPVLFGGRLYSWLQAGSDVDSSDGASVGSTGPRRQSSLVIHGSPVVARPLGPEASGNQSSGRAGDGRGCLVLRYTTRTVHVSSKFWPCLTLPRHPATHFLHTIHPPTQGLLLPFRPVLCIVAQSTLTLQRALVWHHPPPMRLHCVLHSFLSRSLCAPQGQRAGVR